MQTVFQCCPFYGTFNNILVSKVQKKRLKITLAITECQAIKNNDFLCIDLKRNTNFRHLHVNANLLFTAFLNLINQLFILLLI